MDDARIVEQQLGRPLRGHWSVARRCHLGLPMVVQNHPRLEDGSPFPTLYWLTCPILVKRASKLESSGWMAGIGDRLDKDGEFKRRLTDAVESYRARRDAIEVIPEAAPVGGGADRVKCLHAHTAHELADPPNPVGSLVLAEVGWPDCRVGCVP